MAEFAKPGSSFSMQQRHVDGDYAYILWRAETADNSYEIATDTFVVRNRKLWRNPLRPRSFRKPEKVFPGSRAQEIHIVLDNLSAHKRQAEDFLSQNPKVAFTSPHPTRPGLTRSKSGLPRSNVT